MDESSYDAGSRMAWRIMLSECLKQLGYESDEARKAAWILEREAAVTELRMLCAEFGDNEWEVNLHLQDILDKHLGRHLYENRRKIDQEADDFRRYITTVREEERRGYIVPAPIRETWERLAKQSIVCDIAHHYNHEWAVLSYPAHFVLRIKEGE